jgi:anthranilate synthase component 1
MVRQMEELGAPNPDALGVPDAIMMRPTVMVIFDSIKDEITLVTPIRPQAGVTAAQAHARAIERLTAAVDTLEGPLNRSATYTDIDLDVPVVSNTSHERYLEMVAKAKEYIAAGDIFQVVLSQRFEAPFSLPPFALYRALRRTNPSPFLYFLDFGGFAVAGSSPEILVRVRDGEVTIRPIAGTRRRGATPEADKALAAELLADPKELAEHLMLLDLGRNDVGRVAKVGSVRVTEQMQIERYSHVMHIVSNVEGEIDPRHDAIDALIAGFPAGTVSGAPKVRAMEIIDELEPERRGIYAGAVGYFAANGSMDTCIALRTAVVKDGTIYVQAGGGVVADSDPEAEYQESCNKARALLRAAEEAVRFARR